jgi:hypothetical protein
MSHRTSRDAFLAGYLIRLVVLHFDRLDALLRSKELPAAAAMLQALPAAGPETVSRVLHLDRLLVSLGRKAFAPPRTPEECGKWAQAVETAFRDHEVRAPDGSFRTAQEEAFAWPRRIGATISNLEHGLALWEMVDVLREGSPGHAFLDAQRDALIADLAKPLPPKSGAGTPAAGSAYRVAFDAAHDAAAEVRQVAVAKAGRAAVGAALARARTYARAIERSFVAPGPAAAIAAHREGALDREGLYRALLVHPSWWGGGHEGTKRLAWSTPRRPDDAPLGAGWQWVMGSEKTVDGAILNRGTEGELELDRAGFGELLLRAGETMLETAWLDWSAIPRQTLRLWPHPVIVRADGAPQHLPWTDELGRPFAVVCTDPRALALAMDAAKTKLPDGAKIGALPGAQLFAKLREANAPGIVVNPASADRPRTFSRGYLDLLASGA